MLIANNQFNYLCSRPRVRQASEGFTIIELLITTFIIGTVVTGLFGFFVLGLRAAQTGERRVAAIALANEKMEMIRNLAYGAVGTNGGIPSGNIIAEEMVTRNSVAYTVKTDIRYIDDPFDGLAGASMPGKTTIAHQPPGNPGGCQTLSVANQAVPAHQAHGDIIGVPCAGDSDPSGADAVNTDYKQVRVEVVWADSIGSIKPILLITAVVPQGVEGGASEGTLDFQALDASGAAVPEASVTLINNVVIPVINLTTLTNSNGRVVLPGLPAEAGSYELAVTKSNYTNEQTLDQTATFFPDSDHSHMSMIAREITDKTFIIDRVATLNLETKDENQSAIPNISYTLRGTKTIGTSDESLPVYKINETAQTSAAGTHAHTNLTWDSYDIVIASASGYDLKESSQVLPIVLNPADAVTVTLILAPHTPVSLQVTVVNVAGAPVNNATVSLDGNGYSESLGTGIFGQVLFSDIAANGEYVLTVNASGFTPLQQNVTVDGTTRIRVGLTSSN